MQGGVPLPVANPALERTFNTHSRRNTNTCFEPLRFTNTLVRYERSVSWRNPPPPKTQTRFLNFGTNLGKLGAHVGWRQFSHESSDVSAARCRAVWTYPWATALDHATKAHIAMPRRTATSSFMVLCHCTRSSRDHQPPKLLRAPARESRSRQTLLEDTL